MTPLQYRQRYGDPSVGYRLIYRSKSARPDLTVSAWTVVLDPVSNDVIQRSLSQRQFCDPNQSHRLLPTSVLLYSSMLPRLQQLVWHFRPHLSSIPLETPTTTAATMSTFTIPNHSNLTVTTTSDMSQDDLLQFPAFKIWLSTVQRSLGRQKNPKHEFHKDPYVLKKIDIQSVDRFKGGRLGFVKFRADVSNSQGEGLPGSVFLRGGSVGMLVGTLVFFFKTP